jgi:hypothetical protein
MRKSVALGALAAALALMTPPAEAVMTNIGEDRPLIPSPNQLTPHDGRYPEGMLYAPSEDDDPDYRAAIAAFTGMTIDYYDARVGTPSVDLLAAYDCVYTWTDYAYDDPVAFGDNLATYVDGGGTVVLGVFTTYCYGNHLAGRIMTSDYCPVRSPSCENHFSNAAYAHDGTGYIYEGVSDFDCMFRDYLVPQGAGVVDGHYDDGEIAHAYRPYYRVIYSNGGGASVLSGGGDWPRLIANCACPPRPGAPGACCLPDGSCVETSGINCGDWLHGQWTPCVSCAWIQCSEVEACCFTGGFCEMLTDWGCTDRNGEPQGAGSTCSPNPCAASPAGCIDYRDFLHWSCQVATPTLPAGVAVSGAYAYVADGSAGLLVIDPNPHDPHIVGTASMPSGAYDVAVSGTYAYVGAGESGLQVIEVAEPENPVLVGGLDLEGWTNRVVVSGGYAYVTGPGVGFEVIDIADPQNLRVVGFVPGLDGQSVALSGTLAYLAVGEAGLEVIDVANASDPHVIGGVDTPGVAWGVAVRKSHAYVADHDSGLHVVDITSPASPVIVGSVETPDAAFDVAVTDTHAYVADGSGLVMIDITNPGSPQIVHTFGAEEDYRLTIAEGHLYLTDHGSDARLQVFDITSPRIPPIFGGLGMPGSVSGLAASAELVYVADAAGLRVIDVTDPWSPQILGGVNTPGNASDVAVSGTHAYVADGVAGLQVIDVGDPRNPRIVGSAVAQTRAYAVAVSGSYAYLAGGGGSYPYSGSLEVIDVTDPESPQIVGNLFLPGSAVGVAVSGVYAYLVDATIGLQVVDVSNPSLLEMVGSLDLFFAAKDIALRGSYAYIANDVDGLQVVNVEDPADPRPAGVVDTPDRAYGVEIRGTYAYVAGGESGLEVIDVTAPDSFQVIGTLDTPLICDAAAVLGDYVYAADGNNLLVLPAQCDSVPTTSRPDVASIPGLRAYPNPASSRATIRIDLETDRSVRATIHDVAGRLVRNLHDGVLRAGPHDLGWDGRDNAGRPVAPGIYLVRVFTSVGSETARIVILR